MNTTLGRLVVNEAMLLRLRYDLGALTRLEVDAGYSSEKAAQSKRSRVGTPWSASGVPHGTFRSKVPPTNWRKVPGHRQEQQAPCSWCTAIRTSEATWTTINWTLTDYLAILRRRAWLIVGSFFATLVLAVAVALLIPPIYRSTGRS